MLLGCDVGSSTFEPELTPREQFVEAAWPALARCVGCHATQPTIDFLAPGDVELAYTSVFEFQPPVLEVPAPSSSLLLTMGEHTGPALTAPESAAIVGWLEAEKTARAGTTELPVVIGPVVPTIGSITNVDLGFGASLQFVAMPYPGGLYLSELQLTAGPSGLHVVHPLFVSRPTADTQVLDPVDRFGELDLDVAPGQLEPLGAAVFSTFASTDPITIHFRTLEAP